MTVSFALNLIGIAVGQFLIAVGVCSAFFPGALVRFFNWWHRRVLWPNRQNIFLMFTFHTRLGRTDRVVGGLCMVLLGLYVFIGSVRGLLISRQTAQEVVKEQTRHGHGWLSIAFAAALLFVGLGFVFRPLDTFRLLRYDHWFTDAFLGDERLPLRLRVLGAACIVIASQLIIWTVSL
jgi:hypothetical protein